MSIYQELQTRQKENNPIKVGVIGAGQMGFGLISQISRIPGMIVGGVSDIDQTRAQKAVEFYKSEEILKVNTLASSDYREVIQSSNVEVVVDATGVPEVGANISLEALNSRKHLVLLNVEVDITIGSYMNSLFQSSGLVYSGSAGDEPAAIVELYEFAKTMGMKVVVAGKGKK